ncbi:MAG: FUSC family protein [Clostridia bacterium]
MHDDPRVYRIGTYVQVVKAALASSISWYVAEAVFPGARPYFAPLAAVLTVQVSVAQSLARGGQRILGVVGGIAVSLLLAHALGVSAWSVGVLLFVGMAGATLLGFGPAAVTQVGISALLILALKATPAYAAARLLDTIIGAVTAIVVNAVVIPPDSTPLAVRETEELALELGRELHALARACEGDGTFLAVLERMRRLGGEVDQAKARVRAAREGLLYSPLLRRREGRLKRVGEVIGRLDRTSIELRGMSRSFTALWEAGETGLLDLLKMPLAQLGVAFERYQHLVSGSPSGDSDPVAEAVQNARSAALYAFRRLPPEPSPLAFREAGSILADLDKMAADLEESAAILSQLERRGPKPAPAPAKART